MNLMSKTVLLAFPCPTSAFELHFGQQRGRGHSIVVSGATARFGLDVRSKARIKFLFDFT